MMDNNSYYKIAICCCIPVMQYLIMAIGFIGSGYLITSEIHLYYISAIQGTLFIFHIYFIRQDRCIRLHKKRWSLIFIITSLAIILNVVLVLGNDTYVDYYKISFEVLFLTIEAFIIPIYTLLLLCIFVKHEKFEEEEYSYLE